MPDSMPTGAPRWLRIAISLVALVIVYLIAIVAGFLASGFECDGYFVGCHTDHALRGRVVGITVFVVGAVLVVRFGLPPRRPRPPPDRFRPTF